MSSFPGTPASGYRKRKISTTTDDTPPPRKSSLLAGGALGIKINQPGGRSGKENSPSTSSCVSKKSTPGSAGVFGNQLEGDPISKKHVPNTFTRLKFW